MGSLDLCLHVVEVPEHPLRPPVPTLFLRVCARWGGLRCSSVNSPLVLGTFEVDSCHHPSQDSPGTFLPTQTSNSHCPGPAFSDILTVSISALCLSVCVQGDDMTFMNLLLTHPVNHSDLTLLCWESEGLCPKRSVINQMCLSLAVPDGVGSLQVKQSLSAWPCISLIPVFLQPHSPYPENQSYN